MSTIKGKQGFLINDIYFLSYEDFKNKVGWLYKGRAITVIPCLIVYLIIAAYGNFLTNSLTGLLVICIFALSFYVPLDFVLKRIYQIKKENIFFLIVLAIDVLLTTVALHFGGVQDGLFFGAIYLITIIFAGILCNKIITFAIATFAALCYSSLILLEYLKIIPHIATIGIVLTPRQSAAWGISHVLFFYITACLTTLYITPIKKRGSDFYLWGKSLERKLKQIHLEAIKALLNALKVKDPYTENHSSNVAWYSALIIKELKLDAATAHDIRDACFLHDIGKIGIPDNILNKTTGLTEEEWKKIKHHPEFGSEIVAALKGTESVAKMIVQEHERFDGKGYPKGLKGEEICLGAQIISICDAFDVLVSGRHYRRAIALDKAIELIKKDSGSQFSPQIVETFVSVCNRDKKRILRFIHR